MTDKNPRKPRRWVMGLLVVSVAFNLLVVGIVAGWFLSPTSPFRSDMRTARGLVGEPFIRALPHDQRRVLMREALRETQGIRESREALRARFNEFLAALRAEEFDLDAARGLLMDQRQAALGRQDIGETLLLERLASMTPKERRDYADALERHIRRRRH